MTRHGVHFDIVLDNILTVDCEYGFCKEDLERLYDLRHCSSNVMAESLAAVAAGVAAGAVLTTTVCDSMREKMVGEYGLIERNTTAMTSEAEHSVSLCPVETNPCLLRWVISSKNLGVLSPTKSWHLKILPGEEDRVEVLTDVPFHWDETLLQWVNEPPKKSYSTNVRLGDTYGDFVAARQIIADSLTTTPAPPPNSTTTTTTTSTSSTTLTTNATNGTNASDDESTSTTSTTSLPQPAGPTGPTAEEIAFGLAQRQLQTLYEQIQSIQSMGMKFRQLASTDRPKLCGFPENTTTSTTTTTPPRPPALVACYVEKPSVNRANRDVELDLLLLSDRERAQFSPLTKPPWWQIFPAPGENVPISHELRLAEEAVSVENGTYSPYSTKSLRTMREDEFPDLRKKYTLPDLVVKE